MTQAILTPKQNEAQQIFTSNATYLMAFGGSRSGKTTLIVRNLIMRALLTPNSRHACLRFRFIHVKQSICLDTFPKVMRIFFPTVEYTLNKTDWFASFTNGSEIWFGGLDDAERVEKILGREYCTIHLNECSQIKWESVEIVKTRLAQKVEQNVNGSKKLLKNRMYFDCNPPNNNHWTYKVFIKKEHPVTKHLLNADDYNSILMNPADNSQNLNYEYLETLNTLSGHNKQRFLLGEFADANPNALFTYEEIDKWRVIINDKLPQFIRVVVAVDPSGSDEDLSKNNDDIGIMVVGLGVDGNCYVIEDCTCNASPKVWGNVATTAFDRHKANLIVAEVNYGGGMVNQIIQASRANTPFQAVSASRGKHIRAEPIAALYSQGKVRHVGYFQELEEELCAFSTHGYTGTKSPNRADALVWAINSLFPQITNNKKENANFVMLPTLNYFRK